ncbi:unnamed protein product, partial [Staurois parvus]
MSLFVIFKFPAVPSPRTFRRRKERNTEDGCRHPLEEMGEDTAGGHRGSAGQGKRRRDPGATLQCIPECSSALPLVVHSGIPPGRL